MKLDFNLFNFPAKLQFQQCSHILLVLRVADSDPQLKPQASFKQQQLYINKFYSIASTTYSSMTSNYLNSDYCKSFYDVPFAHMGKHTEFLRFT